VLLRKKVVLIYLFGAEGVEGTSWADAKVSRFDILKERNVSYFSMFFAKEGIKRAGILILGNINYVEEDKGKNLDGVISWKR